MPAKSKSQQIAAAIALKNKKEGKGKKGLKGASENMYDMSIEELEKFAKTKHKGLPKKKKNESYCSESLNDFLGSKNLSENLYNFKKTGDIKGDLNIGKSLYEIWSNFINKSLEVLSLNFRELNFEKGNNFPSIDWRLEQNFNYVTVSISLLQKDTESNKKGFYFSGDQYEDDNISGYYSEDIKKFGLNKWISNEYPDLKWTSRIIGPSPTPIPFIEALFQLKKIEIDYELEKTKEKIQKMEMQKIDIYSFDKNIKDLKHKNNL